MQKIILIGSLVFSLILYAIFMKTGGGWILPYILLGLLVSFICAMLLLAKK